MWVLLTSARNELPVLPPEDIGICRGGKFTYEKSSDLLEKKEARKYPVEFEGPRRDVDRIEISLPLGCQVDELPPAADVDYTFGS